MYGRLGLIAFTLIASGAAADVVEIETFAGETAVPSAPDTVIALDLAAVDGLQALGIQPDGVPQIAAPSYLADTMNAATTVGSLFEPDFESIAAMAPDLIIAGGRSQRQVEPLSAIAPTIDMTIWGADMIAQAEARVTAYGEIFDLSEQAAGLVNDLDESIAAAQSAIEGRGDALILLTNGGTISAYGDDSRFGWIHTALGLPEAFPDLTAETHGEAISFEFVAEVDPDWILVIDRAAAIGQEAESAAATLDNPLIAATAAGQSGQVIYLDSAPLYLAGGGIQSLMGTIDEIRRTFEAAGG